MKPLNTQTCADSFDSSLVPKLVGPAGALLPLKQESKHEIILSVLCLFFCNQLLKGCAIENWDGDKQSISHVTSSVNSGAEYSDIVLPLYGGLSNCAAIMPS